MITNNDFCTSNNKTTKQYLIMEYKNFRFGLQKVKVQPNRQQITAEEYERRFDFYKKRFEEEQKNREDALQQAQEEGKIEHPMTEIREQPLGTEPEHLQSLDKKNTINETGLTEENQLPEAINEEPDAQLLEVDRLYLQDTQEPEENVRIDQRHPDQVYKVQSSAQGKKPNN